MTKQILFLLFLIFASQSFAQGDYNKTYAIGIRGGVTHGVTFRQMLSDNTGFQGILTFKNAGFKLTGMKIKTRDYDFPYSNHFFMIKGYGVHIGTEKTDHFTILGRRYNYENEYVAPLFGLDGLLGLEYRFSQIPIHLGLDFKPFIEFSTKSYFSVNIWDIGFYLSYTFN